MSAEERVWYFALMLVSLSTVAIGYSFDIAAAAIFWLIGTLVLLALRPL